MRVRHLSESSFLVQQEFVQTNIQQNRHMATVDRFKELLGSLSADDRKTLADLTSEQNAELLAARSEDARVRLVTGYTEEIRERLQQKK